MTITSSTGEVLSLALNHGEHHEGTLYRLKRGTTLRVVPGVSLLGRHISLSTNYPVKGGAYARNTFHKLQWHHKNGEAMPVQANQCVEVISLDIYCEIVVNTSGSFKFEFEYEERSVGSLLLIIINWLSLTHFDSDQFGCQGGFPVRASGAKDPSGSAQGEKDDSLGLDSMPNGDGQVLGSPGHVAREAAGGP